MTNVEKRCILDRLRMQMRYANRGERWMNSQNRERQVLTGMVMLLSALDIYVHLDVCGARIESAEVLFSGDTEPIKII